MDMLTKKPPIICGKKTPLYCKYDSKIEAIEEKTIYENIILTYILANCAVSP